MFVLLQKWQVYFYTKESDDNKLYILYTQNNLMNMYSWLYFCIISILFIIIVLKNEILLSMFAYKTYMCAAIHFSK